jgi:hypothetical protein
MAHIRALKPPPLNLKHRVGQSVPEGSLHQETALALPTKLIVGNPQ